MSLSHTIWFLMGLVILLPLVRYIPEKSSRLPVAIACWIAYGLHLAADGISGGIAWLHPWRKDVLGSYWIEPQNWIWYDAGFILLVWIIYRVLPGIGRKPLPEDP